MRWAKEIGTNLKRSGFMSLISAGTIAITVFMLGAYYIVQSGVTFLARHIESNVEVTAFLKNNTPQDKTDNIIMETKALAGVAEVRFVTKWDAFQEFIQDPEMKAVMDTFEGNPLPDSIVVRLDTYTREKIERISSFLREKDGVEEVQYGAGEIENLINIVNAVRFIAAAAGIIFIIASMLVVSNIINLTIYARKQDIYIFRMIGADESYIRMPFVAEGVIHGLFGGAAGWAALYGVVTVLIAQIRQETGLDLSVYHIFRPEYFSVRLLLYSVGAGIGLGFTGSLLSQLRMFK
ncbi:MAG TPA: FtsX-like permease family protein [bacterium]|nr:FtsX-like permease family protein [bacterium]